MEQKVLISLREWVAIVTLNRPSVYNALDPALAKDLAEHLVELGLDKAVRGVIITGAGKAFCAGGDLRFIGHFPNGAARAIYEIASSFHQAIQEIRQMKKPVIAAINGAAAGGGFALALACDFRVMGRSSVLRHAYTASGLSLDGGCSFTLPRLVGLARAMEIVAFDAPITAEKAVSWGLITQVAEDGRVVEVAMEMASKLREGSLNAFGECKRLITDSFHTPLETQLRNECISISSTAGHPDGREGIQAFLEKRKPIFLQVASDKQDH